MLSRRHFIAGVAAGTLTAGPSAAQETSSRLAIDTLAIDGPWFDASAALAAGMDAAVVDMPIYPRTRVAALALLDQWQRAERHKKRALGLVRSAADFARHRAAGRFGVVLACQDASILDVSTFSTGDTNLENLEELHARGLRVLQLTHNERNAVADAFPEPVDAGLSRLGHAVVERMNALGLLIDLSHCSERTTEQAIAQSTRPVAVTHGGARALFDTPRNKSDATIRALADKGGFFGVFMMSRWLTDADAATPETVVDHVDHVVRVGGIACVGFGSDQPIAGDPTPQAQKVAQLAAYQQRNTGLPGAEPLHGHVTVPAMDGPGRMQILSAALERRGYVGERLDRILGGNFVRVFGDACG